MKNKFGVSSLRGLCKANLLRTYQRTYFLLIYCISKHYNIKSENLNANPGEYPHEHYVLLIISQIAVAATFKIFAIVFRGKSLSSKISISFLKPANDVFAVPKRKAGADQQRK